MTAYRFDVVWIY